MSTRADQAREAAVERIDEVRRLNVIKAERWRAEARDAIAKKRAVESRRPVAPVFDGEENIEPIECLVDGVIPAEGAGMLFGETKGGKTFVAVDLGVHVAAGLKWRGHDVTRGTVLFFETEGGRAFVVRKHAAKGAVGLGDRKVWDDHGLPFVTVYGKISPYPEAADSIRAAVEAKGFPPIRLVVVDTLAQNMVGDADNNEEMGAFLTDFRDFLKRLSNEPVFGLLIHHPGHGDKTRGRGAYSLNADLDLVMHLKGGADALQLWCDYARDGEPFHVVALRLDTVTVTVDGRPLRNARGRDVTTLVVRSREAGDETRGADPLVGLVEGVLTETPIGVRAVEAKVRAVAGHVPVSRPRVEAALEALRNAGRAAEGPGRKKDSTAWRKKEVAGDAPF